MPLHDEPVQLRDVPGGQVGGSAAGGQGRGAQHPAPYGGWERREDVDPEDVAVRGLRPRATGPLIKGVGVVPEQAGGAGERPGDSGTQTRLERRERVAAYPGASEGRVAVVRVLPRRQPGLRAGGPDDAAVEVE